MINRKSINSVFSLTFAIFLSIIILPSVVRMAFNASSFSAGLMVIVLIIILHGLASTYRGYKISTNSLHLKIIASIAFLGFHGCVNYVLYSNLDVHRFLGSLAFAVLIFIAAIYFVKVSKSWTDNEAVFKLRLVFMILLVTGYIGLTGVSPFSPEGRKTAFFFNEPSHYALDFLPLLLFICITSSSKNRLICIIAGVLLALFYENLTLLIGCALIAALTLPFRTLAYAIMACGLIGFIIGTDLDYYLLRVNIADEESTNMSKLVYLSGWERAILSFNYSFGLGVGFQQFGIVGEQGEIMTTINALSDGFNLNVLDGGSVAPKLIGEFGIFGLMMIIFYLRMFMRLSKQIHINIQKRENYTANYYYLFSCCTVIMYSIDLFIRGTGYFSSSGFVFISSLIFISVSRPEYLCLTKHLRRS
jgi:hypothetical protein